MTINTETSILSFSEAQSYSVQFISNPTNASWSVIDGALPDGMTLSATGLLSGAPSLESAGSIYKATVQADYLGDIGTMDITIGVKFASFDTSAAPQWDFNLDTGDMTGLGMLVDEETGFNTFRLKQFDDFVISFSLSKSGIIQDIPVSNFKMKVKQFEGEDGVDVQTGSLQKIGSGPGYTRYRCGVSFSDDDLAVFLDDESEDINTNVRLIADATFEYWQDTGGATPDTNVRTCNPFHIDLSRKL